MKVSSLVNLARSGRLPLLARVVRLVSAAEELDFYAAASTSGVLRRLAAGPMDLPSLATALGLDPDRDDEALGAWLDLGVSVGALRIEDGRYGLARGLAEGLGHDDNDDLVAILEEAATLHHRLVLDALPLLREGRRLGLEDQSGELTARSSRTLEFIVQEAIDGVVPRSGPLHLLEVGCGSGTHVRHALTRNPELRALALELQPEVAEVARRNLATWGLAERCAVEAGDFRDRTPEPSFDLLTLHNNIYYFPLAERVDVLRHARGFLRPGGTLLITSGGRAGSPAMRTLHLWAVMTRGAGPLPELEDLQAQLAEAGFVDLHSRNLLAPLDHFYAFTARSPT